VWGILCQGFTIEIVKLGWVTRGVGLVSTFVSKYPMHIAKMQNLYRILEQVHTVAVSNTYNLIIVEVCSWLTCLVFAGIHSKCCYCLG